MSKKVLLIAVIFLVSNLSATPVHQIKEPQVQAAITDGNLKWQLDQYLENEKGLDGAIAGISVRDASSGKVIYEHLANTRLRPASNMKLLTAAAALSVLGPKYRFSTEVYTTGKVTGSVLEGDLYLKGKGDPTLLKSDFAKLTKELKEKGITQITGNVFADDSWYDDVRLPLDLPWSDEFTYYGAQISALSASPNEDYDVGSVVVEVTSGNGIGKPGNVKITPDTDYVQIINRVTTVTPDGKKEVKFKREHGSNKIIIEGMIPYKAKLAREWISVWEPTGYALALFRQALSEEKINVNGQFQKGAVPDQATLTLTHSSMPLSELLVPFMKLSNNAHAEILVKEMGRVVKGEGSWEKGLEVMESELKKLGVNTENLVMRDGSGISHVNLVPAQEISQLLYDVQNKDWFPTYLNSLPVAGMEEKMTGGTLRKRMKEAPLRGNVRAKTGSISTVSTLAGYVKTQSGDGVVFSILLNNLTDDDKGKAIEDNLMKILVEHK
ncbi:MULTISPECIES: D-alanyl-D-alanine carboxypeptidase/D-alanyl-D-alanine-endopeptidase [unclassified Bacillus (in: firmicutes)]|uniref:D-alanyl-D-alanine carboxypeptidase/D-alanyl-D-alanine endopeptidase n=1 Tax=unclassified Bacillus (in: firmicutes) TaxID=185979 RepID=UPI0008EC2DA9|nr:MULTISPECIES: D-alanyl-D-alanine carboxypeptidase/D-alanyl-D-alanine-endopeptidase [unclassified Bacillus (in: firmicutes)]SFA90585.1 D-alanyl-D-alanine carboxypeptidase / D-alanyl-D-alanine-endopeptidase (penicillin-binding protein 4) [Bacillus sp. UNCCL13]SFQ85306.1 D-alanyl-D-alanine carboxypeptidase / D-alanyl-D-alanine-endopeptidase (penicillin-binding protein 4) [Bacillus sp. cl95]